MADEVDIRDIAESLVTTPLEIVTTARGKEYAYAFEQGPAGQTQAAVVAKHYGPLPAELAGIDPRLVSAVPSGTDGDPDRVFVSSATVAGLTWAAVGELADRVAALDTRVRELEAERP